MTFSRMRSIGEMRFPGRPEIVRDVRIHVARWLVVELPEAAGDGELLDDLRLLTTELVVNAIKHTVSGRWSKGSFHVRMRLGAGRVRVEVTDQGWWSGPRLRDDAEGAGGRGLHILASVAKRWGVKRRRLGRAVWFELPVPFPATGREPPGWADSGSLLRTDDIHDSVVAPVDISPRNFAEVVDGRSA